MFIFKENQRLHGNKRARNVHYNPTFLANTLALIKFMLRRELLCVYKVHVMGFTLSGFLQGHVIGWEG